MRETSMCVCVNAARERHLCMCVPVVWCNHWRLRDLATIRHSLDALDAVQKEKTHH